MRRACGRVAVLEAGSASFCAAEPEHPRDGDDLEAAYGYRRAKLLPSFSQEYNALTADKANPSGLAQNSLGFQNLGSDQGAACFSLLIARSAKPALASSMPLGHLTSGTYVF